MNGKGDSRRPSRVSLQLRDLKYELCFEKDSKKREILQEKIALLQNTEKQSPPIV